jgi:hypothetical protein
MSDLAQIGIVRTKGFSSWLIRTVTGSYWNHSVNRVSENQVISCEPDGVQILPITDFTPGGRVLDIVWSDFPLSRVQENKIIAFSVLQGPQTVKGVLQPGKPYGRLTFVWIGVAKLLHWRTPYWLERRLDNGQTWICSQLSDAAYQHAGVRLFRDNRPDGAVTPGSLGALFKDCGFTDKA